MRSGAHVLTVVFTMWSTSAAAQEADALDSSVPGEQDPAVAEARARFERGETAYQQGDYDTAIAEWNAAWELDARPRIQFNLSQAYERLGRLTDALAALDRYLETASPDDEHQSVAAARRAALRERLSRTGIRIAGAAPEGATIVVDGEEWGRTPRPDPISVEPGPHRVVVRAQGYRDFQASVVVPAGERVDVAVQMEEAPPPPPPPEGGGSVWPYIFVGAGGAFYLVGGIFGLAALGAADEARASEGPKADAARAAAGVADVNFVIATLALGTGVLWLLLEDDAEQAPDDEAALEVAPWIGPGGAGAGATGRF